MKLEALRLAADLGGARLSGEGGGLVLVERLRAHGLPGVGVLGREPGHLREALEAWAQSEAAINFVGILPLPDTDLAVSLAFHRRRIGALTAALDASLPWLMDRPMLAKRLPGRLATDADLDPAPLGPLERAELQAFLGDAVRLESEFIWPRRWLWPDVPPPEGFEVLVPPLRLAVGSPLMDALRDALRRAFQAPIPLLPLPEDPTGLHALRLLTPDIAAFRGPLEAWKAALLRLAALPAPPHFCARC
ncbi:MAG: hypothetical protein JST05_10855 [Acidobacteria bacterium]|nr:hypothetical protein [Acidobacteriota bacterium]